MLSSIPLFLMPLFTFSPGVRVLATLAYSDVDKIVIVRNSGNKEHKSSYKSKVAIQNSTYKSQKGIYSMTQRKSTFYTV